MRRSVGLAVVAGLCLQATGATEGRAGIERQRDRSTARCDVADETRLVPLPLDLKSDALLADIVAHGDRSRALPLVRDGRVPVVVLAAEGRTADVERRIVCWDGTIAVSEASVGYLRGTVPAERLLALRSLKAVAAMQVDGVLRLPAWSEDESQMLMKAALLKPNRLARGEKRDDPSNFLQLPDVGHLVGLDRLRRDEPTFDGRGVTIALVESASRLAVYHPALRKGLTLDGASVPKIRDVLPLPPGEHAVAVPKVDPESGIVANVEELDVSENIAWVRGLPYRLPFTGVGRLGDVKAGGATYAVAWQPATTATWVDINANGDFRDDPRLYDIRRAEATAALPVTPWPANFYVLHETDHVRVLPITSAHATMTASVAAGADVTGNLAKGFAPGARLVLVDTTDVAHTFFEALIRAARHPSVDIVFTTVPHNNWPASSTSLGGLLMDRLTDVYDKPIFQAASNDYAQEAANQVGHGSVSVGAYVDPASLAAYYAVGDAGREMVWSYSNRGPLLDGSLGVGMLAPATMLAAALCGPHAPAHLPVSSCYVVSSGTSAAAPALAGVAATLLSGARQRGIPVSARQLVRAMRSTARRLADASPIEQGSGLVQADKAWHALLSPTSELVLRIDAPVEHVLGGYRPPDTNMIGLFEREGWSVGDRRRRQIRIKRMNGPAKPQRYALRWVGKHGTFSAPASIVLPLNQWRDLFIDVHPKTAGWHSTVLQLATDDPGDGATDLPFTIVVPEELPALRKGMLSWTFQGHSASRFERVVRVRADTAALIAEVDLSAEAVVRFHEPAGWSFVRQQDEFTSLTLKAGHHTIRIPEPAPGVWSIVVAPVTERGASGAFTCDARLSTLASLRATVTERTETTPGSVSLAMTLDDGVAKSTELDARVGVSLITRHRIEADGKPIAIPIGVPGDAQSLLLRLGAEGRSTPVHTYLYRCTTGTCVRWDVTVPAAAHHARQVDRPREGRWILVVSPGPAFTHAITITVERIVAHSRAGEARVNVRPPQHPQESLLSAHVQASYVRTDAQTRPVLLLSPYVGSRPTAAGASSLVRDRIVPAGLVLPLVREQRPDSTYAVATPRP